MTTDPRGAALRDTQFDNDHLSALGIECMALADLRQRIAPAQLALPERVDFYMVLLITGGTGAHMVDFVQGVLNPGSLVFVQPGQVQQWWLNPSLQGTLVLITAPALHPQNARSAPQDPDGLPMDEWPAVSHLPEALRPEIDQALQTLARDFARFDHGPLDAALIRHDVRGLLMRLGRWFGSQAGGSTAWSEERATYRLLIHELERGFRQRLGVQDYAARLGYSESTLSRACKAAEGRSAKQVIDRRVALEASRQLVHSQASVAEIGHQLGFTEATNFVKFFGRMTGLSPQSFRQKMALQGAGSAG